MILLSIPSFLLCWFGPFTIPTWYHLSLAGSVTPHLKNFFQKKEPGLRETQIKALLLSCVSLRGGISDLPPRRSAGGAHTAQPGITAHGCVSCLLIAISPYSTSAWQTRHGAVRRLAGSNYSVAELPLGCMSVTDADVFPDCCQSGRQGVCGWMTPRMPHGSLSDCNFQLIFRGFCFVLFWNATQPNSGVQWGITQTRAVGGWSVVSDTSASTASALSFSVTRLRLKVPQRSSV